MASGKRARGSAPFRRFVAAALAAPASALPRDPCPATIRADANLATLVARAGEVLRAHPRDCCAWANDVMRLARSHDVRERSVADMVLRVVCGRPLPGAGDAP